MTTISTTDAPSDPGAARLDSATERALYQHYRQFFQKAEEERRWNVWADVPWDAVAAGPSALLVQAVVDAYREELFLPDYSARLLELQRASRGRAWWLTRWSYEEGKHVIALSEWLLRSGAYSDEQLRDFTEAALGAYRWEPPFLDGLASLTEMVVWERREIDRYRALRRLATEAEDGELTYVAGRLLGEEEAHLEFLSSCLGIIARGGHAEAVRDAVRRVAADQPEPEASERALLGLLDLPGDA
jgi:acyl-[acyl-carrier-protein] desaturase